jgi:hypothetical protein
MSGFRTNITIQNASDCSQSLTVGDVPVDGGSEVTLSWLPADCLAAIGVRPEINRDFRLGDGTCIRRPLGYAILWAGEFETIDEVVFAESGDPLKLGVRTLGGFNAKIDRAKNRLVAAGPIPAAGNVQHN